MAVLFFPRGERGHRPRSLHWFKSSTGPRFLSHSGPGAVSDPRPNTSRP